MDKFNNRQKHHLRLIIKAIARTLIGGGGGGGRCLFTYSCFARKISFQNDQIELDLKRNPPGKHEYMKLGIYHSSLPDLRSRLPRLYTMLIAL